MSKEITRLIIEPEVHYSLYVTPPPDHILCQTNPAKVLTHFVRLILTLNTISSSHGGEDEGGSLVDVSEVADAFIIRVLSQKFSGGAEEKREYWFLGRHSELATCRSAALRRDLRGVATTELQLTATCRFATS